jgi:hypothetical protein
MNRLAYDDDGPAAQHGDDAPRAGLGTVLLALLALTSAVAFTAWVFRGCDSARVEVRR